MGGGGGSGRQSPYEGWLGWPLKGGVLRVHPPRTPSSLEIHFGGRVWFFMGEKLSLEPVDLAFSLLDLSLLPLLIFYLSGLFLICSLPNGGYFSGHHLSLLIHFPSLFTVAAALITPGEKLAYLPLCRGTAFIPEVWPEDPV